VNGPGRMKNCYETPRPDLLGTLLRSHPGDEGGPGWRL